MQSNLFYPKWQLDFNTLSYYNFDIYFVKYIGLLVFDEPNIFFCWGACFAGYYLFKPYSLKIWVI